MVGLSGDSFESVLDAARVGAEWAWRIIYESTAPGIRSYLSFRGANDPDGLTGDVFLAAAKKIGAFQGDERGFRAWLYSIAHARLVDERRKNERRRTSPVDPAELVGVADTADAESLALSRLSSEAVARLFALLSPDQRDVLTLRIIADLSLIETASVLKKTVASVKVLQHRGLRRLRELTADEGVTK